MVTDLRMATRTVPTAAAVAVAEGMEVEVEEHTVAAVVTRCQILAQA